MSDPALDHFSGMVDEISSRIDWLIQSRDGLKTERRTLLDGCHEVLKYLEGARPEWAEKRLRQLLVEVEGSRP